MLWVCLGCTTRYACDLAVCPNCGSTRREEYGMPKITVANGATHENDVREETEEWPGTPSSASTKKLPSTSETSEAALPQPVRTTASRSKKGRAASSSAVSETTNGLATDESSDE